MHPHLRSSFCHAPASASGSHVQPLPPLPAGMVKVHPVSCHLPHRLHLLPTQPCAASSQSSPRQSSTSTARNPPLQSAFALLEALSLRIKPTAPGEAGGKAEGRGETQGKDSHARNRPHCYSKRLSCIYMCYVSLLGNQVSAQVLAWEEGVSLLELLRVTHRYTLWPLGLG